MCVEWLLLNRRVIQIVGSDASAFLQGILTNDVNLITRTSALYSLILNAKGRIVHDVFVYLRTDNDYLLEVDQKACANLERMLKIYRLKRKIDISSIELNVGFSKKQVANSVADPRVPKFGHRILGNFSFEQTGEDDYLKRRLEWGIPEGHDELANQLPLNANGDIMNGVNFDKGCYVGQELIARTHYTGVTRRRILPFKCSEPVSGQIVDKDGRKQGKVIKSVGNLGIGLIPLSQIGDKLFVNEVPIEVRRPTWWPKHLAENFA